LPRDDLRLNFGVLPMEPSTGRFQIAAQDSNLRAMTCA